MENVQSTISNNQASVVPQTQVSPMPSTPAIPPGNQGVSPNVTQTVTVRSKKLLLRIIIAFLLLASVLGAIYYFFPKNIVVIESQPIEKTIHVKRLRLGQSASLVVRKISALEGGKNYISSTPFLEPEDYLEFDLPVNTATMPGPGDRVYGVLIADTDNNGEVDLNIDKPLKDILGREYRTYLHVL